MKRTKDAQIIYQIRNKFEEKIDTFPINVQWHYAERNYRITGNKKYTKYIYKYLDKKIPKFKELVNSHTDKSKIIAHGKQLINRIRNKKSSRLQARVHVYEKIPEFKYYQEIVWYLNRFQDYGLTSILKSAPVRDLLEELEQFNYKRYYDNAELLSVDPVQTINTLFHLENLGIIENNITDRIIQFVNDLHPESDQKSDIYNRYYFLTHVLISDSHYYQRFVNKQRFNWIYKHLLSNIKKILNLTNNDLVAEIGVCFKLDKENDYSALNRIKELIRDKLIKNSSLLSKPSANKNTPLYKLEHRNVLAIMLLSDWSQLYPGPKLDFNYTK